MNMSDGEDDITSFNGVLIPLLLNQKDIGKDIVRGLSNYKKEPAARKTEDRIRKISTDIFSLWEQFDKNNKEIIEIESHELKKYFKKN